MVGYGKVREKMIAIIDYGLGNIRAFANVFKRLNMPCRIASRRDELADAARLILPGVGSFDEAMRLLEASGMRAVLDELVLERKIPILGICVGMQMLADSSEEGKSKGLGWIPGEVRKFDGSGLKHKTRLPHMGWNTVEPLRRDNLFRDVPDGGRFYFLHSYYFQCQNPDDALAQTEYGDRFPAAVSKGNVFGVQFHPEKSHHDGVQLLKNFGSLTC